MVTIIKIDKVDGKGWVFEINEAFNDVHGFDIFDCILVKETDCGNYENLFLFMNTYQVNTFIGLLLERNMSCHSKVDFTNEMVNIINSNKVAEFKSTFNGMDDFDDIIDVFTLNNIDKDMVLDKISSLGSTALTENDYVILRA